MDNWELKQKAKSLDNLAIQSAQKAVTFSEEDNIQSLPAAEALLQLIKISWEGKREDIDAKRNYYLQKVETILSKKPQSTRKVYALINLSKFQDNPVSTLIKAVNISKNIDDDLSASFSLGYLGHYYEQTKQYKIAQKWTDKARIAAKLSQNNSSLYRWEWQAGRIYNSLGQTEQAIEAYEQAISSLQLVKSQLTLGKDRQLDFEREIEPVYREMLTLLLSQNPTFERVEQAINVRDLLQLSELENFFGDDCLELLSPNSDRVLENEKTGLIYTIVLPKKTYLIFVSGKNIKSFQVDIVQSELENLVKQWRLDLESRENDSYLFSGRRLYL